MKKDLQRILCVLFCATSAIAADIYWDGTGSDWGAAASWSTDSGATTPDPASAPGASDNAIFNITTVDSAQTVNLNGNQSATNLTFNNTGTTLLQVNGNNTDTYTLSLGGGGVNVNSGAGNVTIGPGATHPNEHVNVALTTGQTWTVADGTQLTLNDSVSGAYAINKTGAGTLTLNGVSNSLSALSVSCAGTGNGAVIVTNSASLTVAGNFFLGDSINNPGTVLQYGGEVNLNGAVRIAHWPNWVGTRSTYTISGGVLNVTNNSLILGWDGQGDLNVNGGTVNAKGIRYGWGSNGGRAGILTLAGGILNIGSSGMSQGQNGTINLNSGTLGSLDTWSTSMNITMGGTVDVDTTGGDITWSGTLSGTGGVVKVGTGTLTLSGANTYSGDTTINGGTLALASGGSIDTESLVRIGASGKMDLDTGIDQTVQKLYLDGEWQPSGTWGSSTSGAIHKDDTYFAGNGILRVSVGPSPSVFRFK